MNESDAGNHPNESQVVVQSPEDAHQPVEVHSEFHLEHVRESWDGPLPPPGALQHYDAVVPGAANRILEMAENQQRNIAELRKAASEREDKALSLADKTLTSDASQSRTVLWLGFILPLVGMAIAAWLVSSGQTWFGLAFLLTQMVGLAGVFVCGSRSRSAERLRNSSNSNEE